MHYPNRFPFEPDWSPAPGHCMECGCGGEKVEATCQYVDCECHSLWLQETDELGPEGLRALWGDR